MTDSEERKRQARQDIAEVLVRYGSGIDRRQWGLFRSCFADRCEADYGDVGAWHGADEITNFMREMHEPLGPTLHRITNQCVELEGDDEATARSYVDALVMGPDSESANRVAGYYDDRLVRLADGWKITSRRFTMIHLETGERMTRDCASEGVRCLFEHHSPALAAGSNPGVDNDGSHHRE